ncbi:MAG: T9SS type A sorting domain-containing protein [Candidatus Neomarinimicrobiota bacterium]|nr:T9SS type A sorting domain-containing protein [Candidatus Neomarinimicrobiota bacterium]
MIRNILSFSFLVMLWVQPILGCRIWAVCTKTGVTLNIISTEELSILNSELYALYIQSQYNPNGWSLLRYDHEQTYPLEPLMRSEHSAYEDSAVYWQTVDMLFQEGTGKIGVGHVRAATSGASSIPNPHPWLFHNDRTYSFVHNGDVSKDLLYNLITNQGMDQSWLDEHPPQTFGGGDWQNDGWSSVVDSELIMLLIMQQVSLSGNILAGLQSAFSMILSQGVSPIMVNSIFSDGESLYIYGGASGLSFAESDFCWSILSGPPSDGAAADLVWEPLFDGELIVIHETGVEHYPSFATIISTDLLLPEPVKLFPAYPNPFNGQAMIKFKVPENAPVSIAIYNSLGNKVYYHQLSRTEKNGGSLVWLPYNDQGKLLPSSSYFIQLVSGSKLLNQKILFIK